MFGNPNLSTAPSIWLQTVTAYQRSWAPAQAFPEVGRGIAGSCCIAHAPAVCKCHGWNYRCWDGSRWSKGLDPIYISRGCRFGLSGSVPSTWDTDNHSQFTFWPCRAKETTDHVLNALICNTNKKDKGTLHKYLAKTFDLRSAFYVPNMSDRSSTVK